MKMTLGQLVQGALNEADYQLKLASEEDASSAPNEKDLEEALTGELSTRELTEEERKKLIEKKLMEEKLREAASDSPAEGDAKTAALADASYAASLVEALGHVGLTFSKIAEELQTFEGQHNVGDTTKNTDTKATTLSQAVASHGGEMSSPTTPRTNEPDYTSPEWKGNREAQKGAIRETTPHSGEMSEMKTSALQSIMDYRHQLRLATKLAADPSSPQASYSASTSANPGALDMVPGDATAIPDNAGLISMTKRQARTEDTRRDAGDVLSEQAFSARSDAGLRDNLSMGLETAKIAKRLLPF